MVIPRTHLHHFEIVSIVAQQGLWWVTYKARGQRSGILSEGGVVPDPVWWLPPLLASAEEEVSRKDIAIERSVGGLKAG